MDKALRLRLINHFGVVGQLVLCFIDAIPTAAEVLCIRFTRYMGMSVTCLFSQGSQLLSCQSHGFAHP
jgi:hypothetical protein